MINLRPQVFKGTGRTGTDSIHRGVRPSSSHIQHAALGFFCLALVIGHAATSIAISPTSVSLQAGQAQQFTATLQGGNTKGLTWSVNNIQGGNSAVGTISTSGAYYAPSSVTSQTSVTVTVNNSSVGKSASATVTITPVISISVTPTSATLAPAQYQQLSANVTGTTNTSVAWSLSPAVGTISASGLYTAPTSLSSQQTVGVTATSMANNSKKATANLTIMPVVSVSVTPASATVGAGQSQQFAAAVSGSTNTGVNWSLNPAVGTILNGLYTAPSSVTTQQTVGVLATSAADPTKSSVAIVTLTPGSAVSISMSPASATLTASQAQQFTASVSGTSNTAVTWTLNPSVGAISASGLYTAPSSITSPQSVTVTATSAADTTKTASATVTLNPPGLTINTTSLPLGVTNTPYSATLAATGGTTPYNWTLSSGQLPPGVALSMPTGAFSGMPTAAGTYNMTVQVTDAAGHMASVALTVLISAGLTVTSLSLPNGTTGSAYTATLTAAGGTAPYTLVLASGQLPPGINLASSGSLSGTPTTAGAYTFSAQVTDSLGATATASLGITISAPSPVNITNSDLPNGTVGTAYSATLTATGGNPPYTWSIAGGALPAGLTLNSSTGAIAGSPTAVGWSNFFTIQVKDSVGNTTSLPYSTIVNPVLDQFGGIVGKTCSSTTGWFHTEKINSRWWLCDPLGNRFWVRAMGGISEGGYASGVLTAKYGATPDQKWSVEQHHRLLSWGFNTIGQVSTPVVWPNGDPLSLIGWVWTSDSLTNQNGYLPAGSSYPKDITNGINNNYTGWRWTTIDYFDPKVWTWLDAKMQNDPAQSVMIASPSTIGVLGDDVDWMGGFGPGVDNETMPVGQTDIHIGWWTMITSPIQTFNPSYQLYPDPTLYSKAGKASPAPTDCSITDPCSLRDYLYLKYSGNIANLNTAWGTGGFYTGFDSTGVSTTETIGTGDGSTTSFTYGLTHSPVSPLSLKILQGGIAQAGDCPWFEGACQETTPYLGLLKGMAGSTLLTGTIPQSNYSDGGSLGVALVLAPGYPPKADYHSVVAYHGISSGKSAEIDVGWGDGTSREPVQLSPAAVSGATGYDVFMSCRVWSGVAPGWGCAASTATFPAPTLQMANVPIGTNWAVPVSGLVQGAALPFDPSYINYSTGQLQVTFSTPPPLGQQIQISYINNGWMSGGTGLMDEDGSHPWVGTNSRCLTPAYMCQGNYQPLPNANANFGADLDPWIAQMSAQYHKQYRAVLKKHNPNMMFLGVDAMGTYNAPARKQIIQGAAPYIDVAFPQYFPNSSLWNYHMTYLGDKPSIVFNTIAATADSALWAASGSYPAQWTGSGYTGSYDFPAQEDRGKAYDYQINGLLNYMSPYGSYPVVGESFWGLTDFPSEAGGINWGLVSLNDNPYDGKSACQTARTDLWGYATGAESVVPSWQAATTYATPNGTSGRIQVSISGTIYTFTVSVSGTSGVLAPAWPTVQGAMVTDGTVTWVNTGLKSSARCFGDAIDYVKQVNSLWWLIN